MQYIEITNNYFADQNTYIAAAGLPKNTKFKKADLYDEIASWNRVCAVTLEPTETLEEELAKVQSDLNAATFDELPTNVVEITADNSFDDLFINWQAAKAPAPTPVKPTKIEPEWTAADDFEVSKFQGTKDRTARALIIHHLNYKG